MGNIEINQRSFYGSVSHTSEFGGHKWQEHGHFHNHKSANFDRKTGSILEGGSSQNKLHISAGEGSRRATATRYEREQNLVGSNLGSPVAARDSRK